MKKYFVKIKEKKEKKPNYFLTTSVQNNPFFKLKKSLTLKVQILD